MYARLCLRDAVSLPAFEEPDGVAHGDGERPALPQKGDQRLQRRVQVAMQLLRDPSIYDIRKYFLPLSLPVCSKMLHKYILFPTQDVIYASSLLRRCHVVGDDALHRPQEGHAARVRPRYGSLGVPEAIARILRHI